MAIEDINPEIDDQELGEREEAAEAYAGEDEHHFVQYCFECAEESRKSRYDVLDAMALLWDAYNNIMDFGDKEDWQSRVVTDRPFTAVERAVSIIRRAFKNPMYISTQGVELNDRDISWDSKKSLDFWLSDRNVDFPRKFCNASRMSLSVGQSMELLPYWDRGLMMDTIAPWKILRDPDAECGEPWSGMYWIHEEWVDKWKIDQGGKTGFYINTDKVKEGGTETTNQPSKEELERRKKQWWDRSSYRKAVLVREFHGVILDRRGDLLLPSAKYTIAGETLIRPPVALPMVNIRWPGSSFSPIPHILRYDGRGIVEGVYELWKTLNKMLSLSMDDFSWVVNRMREFFPELLLDPTDLDLYPGKTLYRTTDHIEQPMVRDLLSKSTMSDLLAFAQYVGQQIDNGDFVTEFVQGLPGSRSQITKGEVELKTEQNMGIFDSIGSEIESGAQNGGYAIWETIVLNWDKDSDPSPTRVLGPDNKFAQFLEGASMTEKKQFLRQDCDVRIVGISQQLQQAEKLKYLMAFKGFAESPMFSPLLKPDKLLREIAGALGMWDASFLKSDEELMQEQAGAEIAKILGKYANDPEVGPMIQQFVQSLMDKEAAEGPPETQGGNGGPPPEPPGGGEEIPGSEIPKVPEPPEVGKIPEISPIA